LAWANTAAAVVREASARILCPRRGRRDLPLRLLHLHALDRFAVTAFGEPGRGEAEQQQNRQRDIRGGGHGHLPEADGWGTLMRQALFLRARRTNSLSNTRFPADCEEDGWPGDAGAAASADCYAGATRRKPDGSPADPSAPLILSPGGLKNICASWGRSTQTALVLFGITEVFSVRW